MFMDERMDSLDEIRGLAPDVAMMMGDMLRSPKVAPIGMGRWGQGKPAHPVGGPASPVPAGPPGRGATLEHSNTRHSKRHSTLEKQTSIHERRNRWLILF